MMYFFGYYFSTNKFINKYQYNIYTFDLDYIQVIILNVLVKSLAIYQVLNVNGCLSQQLCLLPELFC